MKIFSSTQVKNWDAATIEEQHISSIDLMERAANGCFEWLLRHNFTKRHIHIFCGKGNNGGDGLALARILLGNKITVTVHIIESGKSGTTEFQENLRLLHAVTTDTHFIQAVSFFPALENNSLIIDALFGTGLTRPPDGIALHTIGYLNNAALPVISLDIPSGLYAEKSTKGSTVILATHTLSFQNYKLAFLFPENELFIGTVHLLNIGLSKDYETREPAQYELSDIDIIKGIIKPRNKFAHKGNFGHAALVAGSYGMMGAAVLAAASCLRAGTGKLTCIVPSCGYTIVQTSVPEAMCKISGNHFIGTIEDAGSYSAIGIGPGIGVQEETAQMLTKVFSAHPKGLLLDADALNCMAQDEKLLSELPPGTVITPHPKELERLFGFTENDFERLQLAIKKAAAHDIYIVLKGHYTTIITPLGKVYFNSTGNAGMAKAGMGDVLTGIITGLMAQQYSLPEAAMLGVYLHGLAGDIAAEKYSQPGMQAGDLVNCMAEAWKLLIS